MTNQEVFENYGSKRLVIEQNLEFLLQMYWEECHNKYPKEVPSHLLINPVGFVKQFMKEETICDTEFAEKSKMEIVQKTIADGKSLEPDIGKWIVKEESAYPCRGHMRCECDRCGYTKNAEYRDLAYGDTPKYIMPQFCENCGDKKSNTVIYPTK